MRWTILAVGALLTVARPVMACPRTTEVAPSTLSGACVGASRTDCVVYESGRVAASRTLFYQLQGTGPISPPDETRPCFVEDDWCAISIFRLQDSGRLRLVGHAESSSTMPYYFRPYVIATPEGQMVVSQSQSIGTGHFTDDFVFRFGSQCLRRVDVESWKDEPRWRALGGVSDNRGLNYRTLTGDMARTNHRSDEWTRQPMGGHIWVRLALRGDALVLRSWRVTSVPDRY
jgi:hypothetical protein